jgi:hypothetical protein
MVFMGRNFYRSPVIDYGGGFYVRRGFYGVLDKGGFTGPEETRYKDKLGDSL